MTKQLRLRLAQHNVLENQLRQKTDVWRRSFESIVAFIDECEALSGLSEATAAQRRAWLRFRDTHSMEQVALVLDLLTLRDLTIGDFMDAWLVTPDLRMAIHILWRHAATKPTDAGE